jgi:hypothetical protein
MTTPYNFISKTTPIQVRTQQSYKPEQSQSYAETETSRLLHKITKHYLDEAGNLKEDKIPRLQQIILSTYLQLKLKHPPQNSSDDLMLGAEALTLAQKRLDEIIEAKFSQRTDYILLDMVEFFLNPKTIIAHTNMGSDELQSNRSNETKIKRYFNHHPKNNLKNLDTKKHKSGVKKGQISPKNDGGSVFHFPILKEAVL